MDDDVTLKKICEAWSKLLIVQQQSTTRMLFHMTEDEPILNGSVFLANNFIPTQEIRMEFARILENTIEQMSYIKTSAIFHFNPQKAMNTSEKPYYSYELNLVMDAMPDLGSNLEYWFPEETFIIMNNRILGDVIELNLDFTKNIRDMLF